MTNQGTDSYIFTSLNSLVFKKGPKDEVNFLWRKWLHDEQEFSTDPMDVRRKPSEPIQDDDQCEMERHIRTLTIIVQILLTAYFVKSVTH